MNSKEIYRRNLYEILELWSSEKKQLEFQKNVPIANISHELFNDWDCYYGNGNDLETFLNKNEILLFKEFNTTFNNISENTPQILPEISKFIKTEEWKILNKKAKEIFEQLKNITNEY